MSAQKATIKFQLDDVSKIKKYFNGESDSAQKIVTLKANIPDVDGWYRVKILRFTFSSLPEDKIKVLEDLVRPYLNRIFTVDHLRIETDSAQEICDGLYEYCTYTCTTHINGEQ
ncbi:hypothetical protein H4219_001021 [Mycoemilia scoparia]|uniref:Uncharacterized protein n=1 Tax=Mycoemilia scoparia TaxID=417184 RepID=A0A9W8A757_9FUNG|nr:hypothetical protein H4219_001021 [Mycoemilia scoparia]